MTYMNKVHLLLKDMVDELLKNLHELFDNALPQGEGLYFANMEQDDYTVRSSMTVQEADIILRAFYGYECIYSSDDGAYELIEAYSAYDVCDSCTNFKLKDGYVIAKRVREISL